MKKLILLSFCLCSMLWVQAQVFKTVSCTAGGLAAALTANEKSTVTNLTVTGTLNASDFMVFNRRLSMPSLTVLDLSGITKIEAYTGSSAPGGAATYPENELPASAFNIQLNLTSILLPPTITSIGANAFNGCSKLADLIIPSTVTAIGDYAFSGCKVLPSITLPHGLTSIGVYAFSGTAITTITIPANITFFPAYIFAGCTSLTSVDIQGALTSIGQGAFMKCSMLPNFNFQPSLTEILPSAFDQCTALQTIDLHATQITTISGAFTNCSALTSANINTPGLTTMEGAFQSSNALTSIIVPESVTSMKAAFQGCTALQSANIPKNMTVIEISTFERCNSLQSIQIPENVYEIQQSAFAGCSSLTSVTLPAGLATIGDYAFSYSTSLQSITLPADLATLGQNVFDHCSALTSIAIPKNITSLPAAMFSNCTALQSVSLPAGLTSLGARDFENCSSLQSINIPAAVTGILDNCFIGCTGLQSITVNNPTPVDLSNIPAVFTGVPIATSKLQVPETSIALYRNAAQWSDFTTIEKIVVKAAQTITFSDINATFGDAAITLNATASSNLDITYTIEAGKENVATLNGNIVTIVGTGTVQITASQAGNDNYAAATDVTVTLTVNKAAQTITGLSNITKTVGDADFDLSATASSSLSVIYASSNTAVATISGSTLHIVGAGTSTITASQAGNDTYNAAPDVTATLTVNKIAQTISGLLDISKKVGDADFNLAATATSTLPVTYSITDATVATVTNNLVHILKAGSTTITAAQAGNDTYSAATAVTATLTVIATTGIDQVESNTIHLNVYPNPVTGEVVTLTLSEAGQGAFIRVTDLAGKTVLQQALATGSTIATLSVADLSKGIYLVNYTDKAGKRATVKMIK